MPAPRWFFRFMYDRESAALGRRLDGPEHHELVDRYAADLTQLVTAPGPVADLGCGPGAHALAVARRGYEVVGLDGSPRMIEAARARAERDHTDAAFDVHDVGAALPFEDAALGGVQAFLVLQHLPDPAGFLAEVRRCLRQGGYLLLTAPRRTGSPVVPWGLYWRLRAFVLTRVPGLVRFYDPASLRRLVQAAGLTVVDCTAEGNRVKVVARR